MGTDLGTDFSHLYSVVFRGKAGARITHEDYEEAIESLRAARTQLEPDGNNCTVCHDSSHQAWECRHNPLVMARVAAKKETEWRCYHCGLVFTDPVYAAEHFGDDKRNQRPAACVRLLTAIGKAFERYGVHRNFHNAASVKQLVKLVEMQTEARVRARMLHESGSCKKVLHIGDSGWLYDELDDSPYDVDGVSYCGRCHEVLT